MRSIFYDPAMEPYYRKCKPTPRERLMKHLRALTEYRQGVGQHLHSIQHIVDEHPDLCCLVPEEIAAPVRLIINNEPKRRGSPPRYRPRIRLDDDDGPEAA